MDNLLCRSQSEFTLLNNGGRSKTIRFNLFFWRQIQILPPPFFFFPRLFQNMSHIVLHGGKERTKMKENVKQRCQRQSSKGMSMPLLGRPFTRLLFCVKHLCDLPTTSCEQGQLSDLLLPGLH